MEAHGHEAEEEVEVVVVVGPMEEEDHIIRKMEVEAHKIIRIKARFNVTTAMRMGTMQQNVQTQGVREAKKTT